MANNRLLSKLAEVMANENYYEAHQIYRTLYHRLLRANKSLELSKLLYKGSIELLSLKQYNSGADLACLYIDLLVETNNTSADQQLLANNDQILTNIRNLFELIPAKTPERLTFITKAIKLRFLPQSAIRRQFAVVFWREKNFLESRMHFVHSSDSGDDCALMLVEYQTSLGYPTEVDLFIAQFVLQVLCIKNQSMANQTFQVYTSKHPSINCPKPPFLLPLLNFLWLLLLAIDKGHTAKTFKVLCDLYGTTLKRDPSYNEYLSQIGQIYFGLENATRSRGPSGFFGNLLQSLLDNGDDSDEEQSNAGPSRSRTTNSSNNIKHDKSHEVDLD